MIERDPERVELGPVPPGTHSESEPTTAQLVHCCRLLREDRWIVEVETRDERSEPYPLRDGGETREHRPRFPRSPLRPIVAAIQVVIADPDGIEAHLFCRASHRGALGPTDLSFHLGELDADTKILGHAPESRDRRDVGSTGPAEARC
jgi:hypothetical protein